MVMGTRNTINASFGKESDYSWWENASTYTVYDNFTGADSSAWNAAKWTVVGGTINIQSNRGSVVCTATTGTATSKALPFGCDIYMEVYQSYAARPGLTSASGTISVNGVAYWNLLAVGAGHFATESNPTSILIKYMGGITYKIYTGGTYVATITSATAPVIAIQGVSNTYSGSDGVATIIVDNVRYH